MSVRRRIVAPILLLILVGLCSSFWISFAAIQTHGAVRSGDQKAYAALEHVDRGKAAVGELRTFVEQVLEYNAVIEPTVIRLRFETLRDAVAREILLLREKGDGIVSEMELRAIEKSVRDWSAATTEALGIVPVSAPPARHALDRFADRVEARLERAFGVASAHAQAIGAASREQFGNQIQLVLGAMVAVFAVVGGVALIRGGRLARSLSSLANSMEAIRGGEFEAAVSCRSRQDEVGDIARGIVAFGDSLKDLTEAKRRIEHMAHHDILTGLPNRRAMQEHLERLIVGRRRHGRNFAVLHLDLDRFKQINDNLGHGAGDELLRKVAAALQGQIRSGDFAARVGGDEFLVALSDPGNLADVGAAASRMIEAISRPTTIGDKIAQVGASVGIATVDADSGSDAERLLGNADIALYLAKNAGRGRYCFFQEGDRAALERRERLLEELHRGLDRDELVAFFQPQVDGVSGAVLGFEALARWRHPEQGLLGPGVFLDLAFEHGLADRVSDAMVRQATMALAHWRAAGLEAPKVSVNLAGRELRDETVADRLLCALEQTGLSPSDVAVEIVESVLFGDDHDPSIANIQRLSDFGFAIELDDFGTGHASIANLSRFKVDRIKIDRSFVSGLESGTEQERILRAVIELAANLEIDCLAEGVETDSERSKLLSLGCRQFQGFGIAKPMSEAGITDWLVERRSASAKKQLSAR